VQSRHESTELPLLWHLKVSHFNEKARWALDYKRVPHVRRAAVPGRHPAIAKRLTGGTTLPVLILDGEAIGDSSRIIEALERRHPEPPLYPSDAEERRDALAAEEFYDEELGEYTRRLTVHHMLPDASLTLGAFFSDLRGPSRVAARAAFPLVRRRMKATVGADERSVALAFEKLEAASERFRSDVGPNGHLVGGEFTVADLTLASLVAPIVAPAEYPYPQPQRGHPLFAPLRAELVRLGLADWTLDMYSRYRGRSAEIM
jgi:glutathione S-transferase